MNTPKPPPEEPLTITMDGDNVDGDDWNKNHIPPGMHAPDDVEEEGVEKKPPTPPQHSG